MRKFALIFGLMGLFLTATYGGPGDRKHNAPTTQPSPAAEDYRIIVEQNIFSRDRRPPKPPPIERPKPTTTTTSAPAPREVLLTGIAVRDEVRVAFFEDSKTGRTLVFPAGTELEKGKLLSISLDSVEFCSEGKTRKVSIGETLSGTEINASSFGPSTATADSGDSADNGSGDNDVLRRMKARARAERHPRDKKP